MIVPDVVGLQQGQAMSRIGDASLLPASGGAVHDPAPAGQVLSQAVAPGSRVDAGTAVPFVVSLGPQLVEVPDVLGLDETDARAAIKDAGLVVGDPVGSGESDVYAKDLVNAQLPLAGQRVLPGTPVDITITSGVVNDPPVITTAPTLTHVVGGGDWVYDVDATDPDPGDTISYILQAGPLDGDGDPLASIDATNGLITWTPTAADAGPVDFAVRVEDGRGGIDVQSFTLQVRRANEPPAARDDLYTAEPFEPAVVDAENGVLANDVDPDADPLTVTLGVPPANGTVELADDGSFTYTAATPGDAGTATARTRCRVERRQSGVGHADGRRSGR